MKKLLGCVLVLVLAVGLVGPAGACTSPPPQPPIVTIIFNTPTDVTLCFSGYTLFGSGPGQFCTCALNSAASALCIQTVDGVQVMTGGTGMPASGWGAWSASANSSTYFDTQAGSGTWAGFTAALTGTQTAGNPVDIYIDVTLAPACAGDFATLAGDLTAAGLVIGTDEADNTGNGLGTHLAILPVSQAVAVPTLTEWGLILLTVVLIGAGLIMLRRQRRVAAAA